MWKKSKSILKWKRERDRKRKKKPIKSTLVGVFEINTMLKDGKAHELATNREASKGECIMDLVDVCQKTKICT